MVKAVGAGQSGAAAVKFWMIVRALVGMLDIGLLGVVIIMVPLMKVGMK